MTQSIIDYIQRRKFRAAVEAAPFTGRCPEADTPEKQAVVDEVVARWETLLWSAPTTHDPPGIAMLKENA